jgi:acetolactate synthase-1/2/3 large subunit
MGVGVPSAIGAKLANPDRPVVCLSGDGSLFMCPQALHTAAEFDIDVTVVVFNDSDYGIISKSSKIDGDSDDRRFSWTSPDWISIAEGFGCDGRSARTRADLESALDWSMETDGPALIDLDIDGEEPTPYQAVADKSDVDPGTF